jgi:hypothetical protein
MAVVTSLALEFRKSMLRQVDSLVFFLGLDLLLLLRHWQFASARGRSFVDQISSKIFFRLFRQHRPTSRHFNQPNSSDRVGGVAGKLDAL